MILHRLVKKVILKKNAAKSKFKLLIPIKITENVIAKVPPSMHFLFRPVVDLFLAKTYHAQS